MMETAQQESVQSDEEYWYLATPYSKYPYGLEEAWKQACRIAGGLIKKGWRVYSPIAHTHPIALYGNIDPHDHDIWLPFDKPHMNNAKGLLVAKMPSWKDSYGISEEIKEFRKNNKEVLFIEPITLKVEKV